MEAGNCLPHVVHYNLSIPSVVLCVLPVVLCLFQQPLQFVNSHQNNTSEGVVHIGMVLQVLPSLLDLITLDGLADSLFESEVGLLVPVVAIVAYQPLSVLSCL